MSVAHEAPGPAAGYHFQLQRALLTLLTAPSDEHSVAIESLDDIVLSTPDQEALSLEQLKHSIHPGTLSDGSRQWWKSLAVWMDLMDTELYATVGQFSLVTTAIAPEGSAAARLRGGDERNPDEADALLVEAAGNSNDMTTQESRTRFLGLLMRNRRELVRQIRVVDGTPGIGDFRTEVKVLLRAGLPTSGVDLYLDQIVGWWERRAVDLLLRRTRVVTKADLMSEVARIRDGFSANRLPDADVPLDLDAHVTASYRSATFVRQLEFIRMHNERVELAIRDYHRAFAQRSRWMRHGILAPDELRVWEDRLVDEWTHAFARLKQEFANEGSEDALAQAGRDLHDRQQESSRHPLRESRDWFLLRGTQHGLADVRRIGWHRDFQERIEQLLGPLSDIANTDGPFRTAADLHDES